VIANKSRQRNAPYIYDVSKDQGKWRAREFSTGHPNTALHLEQTKAFEYREDALAEVRLWRDKRRASAMIGFRA
jgi:hypothetical protein